MKKLVKQQSTQEQQADLQGKVEDVLARAKAQGASDAEVSLSLDHGFTVTARDGDVETVEFNRGRDINVTVYFGQRLGSASTTDTTDKALQETVEAACRIARYTDEDPCAGLAESEQFATKCPDLDLYHPWHLTTEEAIELAKQCEASGLANKRITKSEGAEVSTHQSLFFCGNSRGFVGGYPSTHHSMHCTLIAEHEGAMERDYDYTVSRDAADLLSVDVIGAKAAERTVSRLNGQKIKTQKAPVIFEANIASSLIGRFLSAISGGNLYRQSSFLLDNMGHSIFPDCINLYEDPLIPKALGSAPFDHDGLPCTKKYFIEEGVLTQYLLSVYSARQLKLAPTGNAGGAHNVKITHSDHDLPALFKKMDTGLFVTEVMGQGVNLVTGDYSQGASGFWVQGGKIQYPVSGITIAGNLRDMFANLVCVGNDIDTRHNILTGSILLDTMMIAGS